MLHLKLFKLGVTRALHAYIMQKFVKMKGFERFLGWH